MLQRELDDFSYDRKKGSEGGKELKKHLTDENYSKWASYNDEVAEKPDTVKTEGGIVKVENGIKKDPNGIKKDPVQYPSVVQRPISFDSATCANCGLARRNTRFSPCRHSVMCERCAELFVKRGDPCPECKKVIETIEIGDWSTTVRVKRQASQSSEEDFA